MQSYFLVIILFLIGFLTVSSSTPILTPGGWNDSDSEYFDFRYWKILDPNWPTRSKREMNEDLTQGLDFDQLLRCTKTTIVPRTTEISIERESPFQVIDEGLPIQEQLRMPEPGD